MCFSSAVLVGGSSTGLLCMPLFLFLNPSHACLVTCTATHKFDLLLSSFQATEIAFQTSCFVHPLSCWNLRLLNLAVIGRTRGGSEIWLKVRHRKSWRLKWTLVKKLTMQQKEASSSFKLRLICQVGRTDPQLKSEDWSHQKLEYLSLCRCTGSYPPSLRSSPADFLSGGCWTLILGPASSSAHKQTNKQTKMILFVFNYLPISDHKHQFWLIKLIFHNPAGSCCAVNIRADSAWFFLVFQHHRHCMWGRLGLIEVKPEQNLYITL